MEDQDNPCLGVCMIGADGICEGCGRSEEEIYGAAPEAGEAAEKAAPTAAE